MNPQRIEDLLARQEAIEQAAKESAEAEAAVVVAEEEARTLSHDDGTIDPGELVDRRQRADKSLAMAKIIANRAACRLSQLEANFEADALETAREASQALHSARERRISEVREILHSLLPEREREREFVKDFIDVCEGVNDRRAVAFQLTRAQNARRICVVLHDAGPLLD